MVKKMKAKTLGLIEKIVCGTIITACVAVLIIVLLAGCTSITYTDTEGNTIKYRALGKKIHAKATVGEDGIVEIVYDTDYNALLKTVEVTTLAAIAAGKK